MKAITARKGAPHITPIMDAMWHQGVLETESCILNCYDRFAAEVVSNNELRISPGAGMLQGRFFCIEPGEVDSVTIANGNQGENRIDLVVVRWIVDNATNTQEAALKVVQGAPVAGTPEEAEIITGNLDAGDLMADFLLYRVNIEGLSLAKVEPAFSAGWIISDETIAAFAKAGLPITGGK